jgi:saccharopine dehydrogenase-like NADP-dependent oxidoreductase
MKNRILVLGAGLVARPLVRYLLDHGFDLVVADLSRSKAEAIIGGHPKGRPVELDLTDSAALAALVCGCDLAVSLVPYVYHVQVARMCLVHRKHLVTTSYVSNEMRELSGEAAEKELLFLNEIGLDPGIDHMSAMKVMDGVRSQGGTITGFHSCCGGLPAPDCNDNPWGYKFSWSPRGVLLAGRNAASYLSDGQLMDVPPQDLFLHHGSVDVEGAGTLEAYPNRNSLQYVSLYGLETAKSMFRGTLRYPGWCATMKAMGDFGWFSLDPVPNGVKTMRQLSAHLAGLPRESTTAELLAWASRSLGLQPQSNPLERMKWAGLFDDIDLGKVPSVLDALCAVLEGRLAYQPGQRDMVALHHTFQTVSGQGKAQRITSTLVEFGIPNGDSAMSRTVSLPAAIAARMILDGAIRLSGVHVPVHSHIYRPVLQALDELGVRFVERVVDV